MKLTEKYRPKTLKEFVGNKENMEEAFRYVKSDFPVILVGPPGCGKTTAGYVIANELGYDVIESNASDERKKADFEELEIALRSRLLTKSIFLLDEIDGVKDQLHLATILKKAKNPVVLTANDKRKIAKEMTKVCKLIEFDKPKLQEVANRIKYIADSEGLKDINYNLITTDFRESIHRVFYNSTKYIINKNEFEKVDDIFKHKAVHDIEIIWLLDNVCNFYCGRDLLEAIEVIKNYKRLKNPDVLLSLPKGTGRAKFPGFLRLVRK